MRIFDKFPEHDKCIICNTNEQKQCVLIPIIGTQKDNIIQARPVHLECLLDGLSIHIIQDYQTLIGMVIKK